MASASRTPGVKKERRDFPVGVPIKPPPGWQPPPLPASVAGAQVAHSPFRSQMALVLQAIMLAMLVFVCTTVGWLWVQGPRKAKNKNPAVAKVGTPSKPQKAPTHPEAIIPEDRTPTPMVPAPPNNPPRTQPQPEPPPVVVPRSVPEQPGLTYEKDILPIMQRSCVSCHGGTKKRGGLDLRTFAALVRGGDSGTGIRPGKPDDSSLLESIVSGRMPPGRGKLTPAEKQLIRDWIASGAKSNRGR